MDEKTLLTKLAVYEVAVKVYSNLLTNSTKALEQAQQDMSTYIPSSAKCHCCAPRRVSGTSGAISATFAKTVCTTTAVKGNGGITMRQRNEGLEHYLACHVMDGDYDPRGDYQSEIVPSCFAMPTDWQFDGHVYYCPDCDGIALYDKKGRQELSYYCPSCGRYMLKDSV